MQEYPKWKYHRVEPPRIVNDPEEDAALGPGWAETPAAFESVEPLETEARKPKKK